MWHTEGSEQAEITAMRTLLSHSYPARVAIPILPVTILLMLTLCSTVAPGGSQDAPATNAVGSSSDTVFLRAEDPEHVLHELGMAGLRVAIMGEEGVSLRIPAAFRWRTVPAEQSVEAIARHGGMRVWWNASRTCTVLYRGATDPAVARVLEGLVPSASPNVRSRAAWEAGWVQDPRVIPALAEAALFPDRGVSVSARTSLRRLGWRTSAILVPGATAKLLDGELGLDRAVYRTAAARALNSLSPELALPLLKKATSDSCESVRFEAVNALSSIRVAEAADIIRSMPVTTHDIEGQRRMQALAQAQGTAAMEWIVPLLESDDPSDRYQGALSLGAIGTTNVLPRLAEACRDEFDSVREAAMQAFASVRDPGAAMIAARCLSDPERRVRSSAAEALAKIGGETSLLFLEKAFGVQTNADTRAAILCAIGKIPGERAMAFLASAFRDPKTQLSAIWAMGDRCEKMAVELLGEATSSTNANIRQSAFRALCSIGSDEAMPWIARGIVDPDVEVRRTVVSSIDGSATNALPLLETALRDQAEVVRSIAARGLGRNASESAFTLLKELTRDANPRTWEDLVHAAFLLGGERGLSILRIALRREDSSVRTAAARTLPRIGGDECMERLRELARSSAPEIRAQAINGLAWADAPDAPDAIRRGLADPDLSVRIAAARCVWSLDARLVAEFLEEVYRSPDPEVRKIVFSDLDGTQRLGIYLDATLPLLRRGLKDGDGTVRERAVEALALIGDDRMFDLLDLVLGDPEQRIRQLAVEWAGCSVKGPPSPRAMQWYKTAMTNSDQRVRAAVFVSFAATAAEVSSIEKAWRDLDEDARLAVMESQRLTYLPRKLLVFEWGCADADPKVRRAAMTAVTYLGRRKAAVPLAVRCLKDDDATVRLLALCALKVLAPSQIADQAIVSAHDADPAVRMRAAILLGESADLKVFPVVSELAGDTNDMVRTVALIALAKVGGSNAVPILVSNLRHPTESVRYNAVHALGETGATSAIPFLEDLLNGTNRILRVDAARAVEKIGSADALPLLTRFQNDTDPYVRGAVLSALTKMEKTTALARIQKAMSDPDEATRRAALVSLSSLPIEASFPTYARAIYDSSESVRDFAATMMIDFDSEQSWAVLQKASQDRDHPDVAKTVVGKIVYHPKDQTFRILEGILRNGDVELRRHAVSAMANGLVRLGFQKLLALAFADSDADVRLRVAYVMGQQSREDFVALMRKALKDPDPRIRRLVLWVAKTQGFWEKRDGTLQEVPADLTKQAMLDRMVRDPDREIRLAAISELSEAKMDGAADLLMFAAGDGEDVTQGMALDALGKIQREKAIPFLREKLTNSSFLVRAGAINGLGNAGGDAAWTLIERALTDDHRYPRQCALMALTKIGGRKAFPLLRRHLTDQDPLVLQTAIRSIASIKDPESVAILAEVLTTTNHPGRGYAISSLARMPDPKAQVIAESVLFDSDPRIRGAVVYGLGETQRQRALPWLERMTGDPDAGVRRLTAEVLYKTGGDKARDILVSSYSKESDKEVRDLIRLYLKSRWQLEVKVEEQPGTPSLRVVERQ